MYTASTRPEWVSELLALGQIEGWSIAPDEVPFPSAAESLVIRVTESSSGRRGVLKASAVDPGRVLNEGNYLGELRGRARRLVGDARGFPEVLLRPTQIALPKCGKRPAVFVEEELGQSLQQMMDRRGGKPLPIPQVALFGLQMCRRLQVMHTQERSLGLTHCDLKPGNVLIDTQGTVYYLVDLDCATAIPTVPMKAGPRKGVKKVQGTYTFTGCDSLLGYAPSPKSDLDSLGQMLLWAAHGRVVWKGTTIDQLASEKEQWRNLPYSKRPHVGVFPKEFEAFFSAIEALQDLQRPDYDALAACLGEFAAKTIDLGPLGPEEANPAPAPARVAVAPVPVVKLPVQEASENIHEVAVVAKKTPANTKKPSTQPKPARGAAAKRIATITPSEELEGAKAPTPAKKSSRSRELRLLQEEANRFVGAKVVVAKPATRRAGGGRRANNNNNQQQEEASE